MDENSTREQNMQFLKKLNFMRKKARLSQETHNSKAKTRRLVSKNTEIYICKTARINLLQKLWCFVDGRKVNESRIINRADNASWSP